MLNSNVVKIGSISRVAGLQIGSDGQYAYIYNESGDNLNFRYKNSSGDVAYSSMAWICDSINTHTNNLSKIKTYVGTDGKLHFTDSAGADTVIPFNSETKLTLTGCVSNQFGDSKASSFTYTAVTDCRYRVQCSYGGWTGGAASTTIAGSAYDSPWSEAWSIDKSGTLKAGQTIVVNAYAGGASGQYAYNTYTISINP